ncbi:MMPL family transporter [Micromonospora sp. NPDC050686]|uniref:MMPL family transporter n=1 Tax=Micromonospora sp. NPDC050686 TaxID=3154631 RepID=UPI0033C08B30
MVVAAGLIMAAVFVAFAASPEPAVRMTAAALAAALLVDLFVVRLLVLPALLTLLGSRAWRGGSMGARPAAGHAGGRRPAAERSRPAGAATRRAGVSPRGRGRGPGHRR